ATTSPQGFKDGANNNTEYGYDDNGNMTRDDNKGITNIVYNHLNLPTEIVFGTNKIEYFYNATGQKVVKKVTENTAVTTTTYLAGGFQYENSVLQFFPHAEGYVKKESSSYKYVFNYTDHLGNIRLSYSDVDNSGSIAIDEIVEENEYYPFGLKHNTYPSSNAYEYKYNGKELQDELGLNMYDYGARNYDPALGRWMNIDPKTELMRRFSPYNYAFNNPMYFIDPDGMAPEGTDPEKGWFGRAWDKVKNWFSSSPKNSGYVEIGNAVAKFLEENELVADFKFDSRFSIGAGISVSAGDSNISANGELVGVELLEVSGSLLDENSFEGDYILKDGEMEVSQSVDVSISNGKTKYTLVEGENSFTAHGSDLDRTKNEKSSFDYLSKTTSSLESSNKEPGKGISVKTKGPGDNNPTAKIDAVSKEGSSTFKGSIKGGIIMKIGLSLELGFKKKK
ncbi:RHS repeat domain-containing protein, partial [Flavobacterium sp. NRK F7]|uniref:RHS repeat domain-containing protein n=1 Tax=Flavobacterium sp. NRK F7 TaxID=2954930 RepID=UPI002091055B